MNDEEAVSPVIAVILMVAITVVLAATVFVLVNELGQDVGQTGPTLGLTTSGTPNSDSWQVRITSATQALPMDQYTFILTDPDGNTHSVAFNDEETGAGCDDGAGGQNDQGANDCWWTGGAAAGADGYEVTFSSIQGDNMAVGERLTIEGTTNDDFSTSGQYTTELIHRPTGTSSGSISRTV